jgi:hypothetical protein
MGNACLPRPTKPGIAACTAGSERYTPVRHAVYPWIATVTQGYTAGVEGGAFRPVRRQGDQRAFLAPKYLDKLCAGKIAHAKARQRSAVGRTYPGLGWGAHLVLGWGRGRQRDGLGIECWMAHPPTRRASQRRAANVPTQAKSSQTPPKCPTTRLHLHTRKEYISSVPVHYPVVTHPAFRLGRGVGAVLHHQQHRGAASQTTPSR